MSEPKDPDPEKKAVVTSLVDRLPPARRARRRVEVALQEHERARGSLARFGVMAEHLEALDVDYMFAELERMPPGVPGGREAWVACRSARAARNFLRGEPDAAFAEWEETIAEDPEHAAPALLMRSTFHVVRDDLEAALADVSRAIELEPTNARAYSRRGDLLQEMERDGEALANYRRAAQLDPRDARAAAGMGACFYLEDDWAQGIKWYSRAIKLAPKQGDLYLGRALCLEGEEKLAEAIEDLDQAILLDPKDADAFHERGICKQELGDEEGGRADLERAVELGYRSKLQDTTPPRG